MSTYATLDEIKSRIQLTDVQDDTHITDALEAATETIDGFCHRHFRVPEAGSSRIYTPDSRWTVAIDDATEVTQVEERSSPDGVWQAVDVSSYVLEPANADADGWPFERIIRVSGCWPDAPQSVRVTGSFGWPATPSAVKNACITQTIRLVNRPRAPFGIAGVGMDEPGMRLLAKLDADVEVALRRYVRAIPGLLG